jgi:hypothetical protein
MLAERILEPASGDLSDLVTDAYLRQDMEWVLDEQAQVRPSSDSSRNTLPSSRTVQV